MLRVDVRGTVCMLQHCWQYPHFKVYVENVARMRLEKSAKSAADKDQRVQPIKRRLLSKAFRKPSTLILGRGLLPTEEAGADATNRRWLGSGGVASGRASGWTSGILGRVSRRSIATVEEGAEEEDDDDKADTAARLTALTPAKTFTASLADAPPPAVQDAPSNEHHGQERFFA